jgi:hypothetical protein
MDNSCRNRNEFLIPTANHLAFNSKYLLNIRALSRQRRLKAARQR